MLNDDFRFNVGTGCFYEYDANARTKAVSLFSTVAAYAITWVLGPFDTTCIANQHRCLPDRILPSGTAIKCISRHPVTLAPPCGRLNEEVSHRRDLGRHGRGHHAAVLQMER